MAFAGALYLAMDCAMEVTGTARGKMRQVRRGKEEEARKSQRWLGQPEGSVLQEGAILPWGLPATLRVYCTVSRASAVDFMGSCGAQERPMSARKVADKARRRLRRFAIV